MDLESLTGYKVFIKDAGGNRIRANDKGSMDYVKGARGKWEKFVINKVGDGQYVILTHWNTYFHFREASTFRSAKLEQGERGDTNIGRLERFTFLPQDDGKSYVIQTPVGTYIHSRGDGKVGVSDAGEKIGPKEIFHIELALPEKEGGLPDYQSTNIAFETKDATYIRGARNNVLDTKSNAMGPWELFELVPQEDDDDATTQFAIRNVHHKKFIRARKKNAVLDQSDTAGAWEKFKIFRYDDQRFAIQTAHGTFLGVHGDSIKHGSRIGPEQLFKINIEEEE